MNAIRTIHNLPFEASDYFQHYGIDDGYGWKGFRIGTCEGLWTEKGRCYRILALMNKDPHNGHLDDVFQWFMYSCKRDGFPLVVHEVMNKAMGRILLKRDFLPVFGTKNFKWWP